MIDDIKFIMESKLEPLLEKIPPGKAEVKAIFGGGNQDNYFFLYLKCIRLYLFSQKLQDCYYE